ncbi:hypothetical protein ORIO_09955 [Cereibacter azotoformans]|uniref:hypothetical protein n=1 Tax=Cereibacter azotoformans TaxID=43057 RepID=UPI001EEBD86A|nr:hypothetical protein [Cereibacter azotoformans]ULB10227.1 hypothetical protein ORIO_09955 [Cereibacter azotoformans]
MTSTYVWDDPRPSRAAKPIPKSSHGHFVVQMVIHDSDEDPGQISMCGSLGEYRTRLIALAEPDTVDVIEQVGPVPWTDENGKTHGHYIDQIVVKTGNRRLGLTDKPYRRVTPAFEAEIAQVDAAARKAGVIDRLHLVTEYARDPVKLHNADLFRGCRDADPEVDALAAEVVAALDGEAPLQKLVGEINRGPRGFRALVRLLRSGQLRMVSEEKISHATRVARGRAVR